MRSVKLSCGLCRIPKEGKLKHKRKPAVAQTLLVCARPRKKHRTAFRRLIWRASETVLITEVAPERQILLHDRMTTAEVDAVTALTKPLGDALDCSPYLRETQAPLTVRSKGTHNDLQARERTPPHTRARARAFT